MGVQHGIHVAPGAIGREVEFKLGERAAAPLEYLALQVHHQKRRLIDVALGDGATGDEQPIPAQAHRCVAVVVGDPAVLVQAPRNGDHLRSQPRQRRERHQASTLLITPTISERMGARSSLSSCRAPLPSRLTSTRSPGPEEHARSTAMKLVPTGLFRSLIGWTTIRRRPEKAGCLAVDVTVPSTLQSVTRPPNRRCRRWRCPPGRNAVRAPAPPREPQRDTPGPSGARTPCPPRPPEGLMVAADGPRVGR